MQKFTIFLIMPPILSTIPFLKPSMKSFPICKATPGRDFTILAKLSPSLVAKSEMFISPEVSLSKASRIEFNASINFLTAGVSLNALNHSLIFLTAFGIFDITQSKAFAIELFSTSQSLNLTSISPIEAVTSKMLRSNCSSIEETILKAILSPPPAIVFIMSRTANKPLNVFVSCSACRSVGINDAVNL